MSLLSTLPDRPVKLILIDLCLGMHSFKKLINAYSVLDIVLVLRITKMNTIQSLFAFQCEVAITLIWKNG